MTQIPPGAVPGVAADKEPLGASDLEQIREHGLEPAEVERQLQLLAQPPAPARLVRACTVGDGTVGDGIVRLDPASFDHYRDLYLEAEGQGRFAKLVPASGAASRMFGALLAARAELRAGENEGTDANEGADAREENRQAAHRFLQQVGQFPFYRALRDELERRGLDLDALCAENDYGPVLEALLDDDGLGYGAAPKGLVPFHFDGERPITPLEEHLVEAAEHLRARDGRCRVHFTIPQHREMAFREQLREIASRLEPRYDASFDVSLSIQMPETDTVAGDPEGGPFRDADGRLVFRPGGHGALLANLGRFGRDLVFVRNIDNVQPEPRRREILRWNRILGGYLVALEQAIVEILSRLEGRDSDQLRIDEDVRRAAELLGRPQWLELLERPPREQRAMLLDLLDRPLRVAGVVPNVGEPGGGPFWVADADGRETPQIVEMSQVDLDRPDQARIVADATHFNPVHLVCRLRSHRDELYDLDRFVDPEAVFIARKTHGGRPVLALERPGLWNGAMARWNTVFVEVPGTIFAPVKTVFDLLRPEHQARQPGSEGR